MAGRMCLRKRSFMDCHECRVTAASSAAFHSSVPVTDDPAAPASRTNASMASSSSAAEPLPAAAAAASSNGAHGGAAAAPEEDRSGGGYRQPPPEIAAIVDAPPTPALSFSPLRTEILFLERPALQPVAELARPELKLAGIRLDPECNTRSRMSFYTGMKVAKLAEDGTLGPERAITGLPEGAKINFVSWSPSGKYIGFTLRTTEEEGSARDLLGLWVVDVAGGQARHLMGPSDYALNTMFDSYSWLDDESLIVATIPHQRGPPPKKPLTPYGPTIQMSEVGKVSQARTYQDLLKDKHDEKLFEYYGTAQLVKVDLSGQVSLFGEPKLYTSIDPSPDEKYILITSIERPFSLLVPCGRFPKRVEVWNRDAEVVQEVAYLPLAEDIPITFNSVRQGRRSINWRADQPAQLCWVETQDGGDAKVEVSPRDIVYTHPAEPARGEAPDVVHQLDLRYGGITWGDEGLALVYESWFKTRRTVTWRIAPNNSVPPKVLFDRSYEDSYSDPGSPMLRRTKWGSYVLARIATADGKRKLLLDGDGATPEGNFPFLDLLDIETGETERIWQSPKEEWFESVATLMSDWRQGDLTFDQLRILISRESQMEPPQYFMRRWSDQTMKQITFFPHPYPQLKGLSKEIICYQREDGVQLTATLYLPPDYNPAVDGPRPMLMWAYPREFKSKDAAGQVRGSQYSFAGIGSTSALLWLAKGYTILDGPTFPIVGEGDVEANDSYVDQLVASAQAAVKEVVRRGVNTPVADPGKIAIGGHSYGAFMAANLLAHAPELFACGIARSGAYNRTLTPFGFQSEERTLWEAPEVYVQMSPFMLANKIKKPLLLIHGEDDNNTGTFPMQSERFFAALKGHGAPCRLVLLPHESHGYRGRESVMHTLAEMDAWLEENCVGGASSNGTSSAASLAGEVKVAAGVAESGASNTGRSVKLVGDGRPLSAL
eukprot:SM000119S25651  [mRNA]  locus=s119:274744:280961:+ [translate_table: standard]